MKSITLLFVLILAMGTGSAQNAYDRFEVQVDGLGCPFCAYGLEKKFKEFKGIKDVRIEIETGHFTFAYPSVEKLVLEDVEKQVIKAGYTPIAGSVTRADGTIEAMHQPQAGLGDGGDMEHATAKVAGNCEMCKARIEKAALNHPGVSAVSWDKDTKLLDVDFNSQVTSLEAIEKSIADIGHDTEHHRAHKDAYENLPGCCHYERINPKKVQK
jgi:copper chaperone CopZ